MARHWLILVIVGLALLPSGSQAKVGWMVYPYRIPVEDEYYQRLLNCQEAEYVGVQWRARDSYSPEDLLQRQRAAELRRAGKKLIVDLWFGSTPPFSWRYFNFPGIALDPQVRQDFFDRCADPFIEHYGAENMYAVHLLEETGMQFSWDSDVPGYPEGQIGYGNSNSYDNPSSFEWPRGISGPYNLNVRKYNEFLRQETGLDMRLAPIWSSAEKVRFNTWVQQRMEAGAHNEFARHVHQKYPGLKVYAFNSGAALIPQSQVLDGQFIDRYSATNVVYNAIRQFRAVMRPDQDLVTMTWGSRQKPLNQRMAQQAACFLGGADILSTYNDHEVEGDEWLNIVRDSMRPFLGRPRFVSHSPLLCLGGSPLAGMTLSAGDYWTTGFAHYEVAAARSGGMGKYDLPGVEGPLDRYKIVFSWGTMRPDLEEWVRQGGILVGVYTGADLLLKAGLLEDLHESVRTQPLEYKPGKWMRENLRLRESYPLELMYIQQYAAPEGSAIHRDELVYAAEYGKGFIVLLPALCDVHAPWQYESHWEVYRQLITDLCRGALLHRNLAAVAEQCLDEPALGNDYLRVTSDDGKLTVYVLLNDVHGPHKSQTSFVVPGKDVITGKTDVTFGEEHPVVMIENG